MELIQQKLRQCCTTNYPKLYFTHNYQFLANRLNLRQLERASVAVTFSDGTQHRVASKSSSRLATSQRFVTHSTVRVATICKSYLMTLT
jgi:DNA primase catalytic subunit